MRPRIDRPGPAPMTIRTAALLLAALALGACVGSRPEPPPQACIATQGTAGKQAELPFSASVADAVGEMLTAPAGGKRDRMSILVLSGGGSWGAYGAGFLNGWSARAEGRGHPRPQFDIVTGVSTGAIIAPFALLGPDYDPTIAAAYRGVRSADLFELRSLVRLPYWNSLTEPVQLEHRLERALDARAIAGLAAAAREKRAVWIGAVNYDTGAFTRFNLTELALRGDEAAARHAIVERILAASAVPVLFPPRFINGCMYMDGGVRENLFVAEIGDSIDAAIGGWRAWGLAKVDIYVIVNGNVEIQPRTTENTLIDVATRSFELAAGQIQLASLRRIYDFARDNDYRLHWTSADELLSAAGEPGKCRPPKDTADQFDPEFTTCLFEGARVKAQFDPEPWREDRP